MFREVLTYDQAERFYILRNALAVVGGQWLGRPLDTFFGDDPLDLDGAEVREVLSEIWRTPEVIERFVAENPLRLPAEELAIVESWKNVLSDHFIVFDNGGALLFLNGKRIFHVTGLLDPIRELLEDEEFPCLVKANLLPFGKYVVHDGFLVTPPVRMLPNMKQMIAEDVARALSDSEHISTGAQLERVAPLMIEERIKQEAERMIEDLEMDAKANEQLPEHHKGALAGLDDAARDVALENYLDNEVIGAASANITAILEDRCTEGPVRRDLVGLLKTEDREWLRSWAEVMELPTEKLRTKSQLAEALAKRFLESRHLMTVLLMDLNQRDLESLRKVYEAGGELRMGADALLEVFGSASLISPITYLFKDGDEFVRVIPNEFMEQLALYDWEGNLAAVREAQEAVDIAEALVSLRGILLVEEAFEEYRRIYPDALPYEDFADCLEGAVADNTATYELLDAYDDAIYDVPASTAESRGPAAGSDGDAAGRETHEGFYLLSFNLAREYRDAVDIGETTTYSPVLEGPIDFLAAILEQRKGKTPRGLGDNMRTARDVLSFKQSLPAVRAMRDYLDEHVPDDADDYMFADGAVLDLISQMSVGTMSADAIKGYYEVLEDHGLQVDEAHFRRVIDLLMNMVNAMPTWLNNGWSPNELREASGGPRVFYNPDGSVMKVGRNDPCPCGSGKKYKKCCGR